MDIQILFNDYSCFEDGRANLYSFVNSQDKRCKDVDGWTSEKQIYFAQGNKLRNISKTPISSNVISCLSNIYLSRIPLSPCLTLIKYLDYNYIGIRGN